MNNNKQIDAEIYKKKSSSILILTIYSAQLVTAVVIYNLSLLSDYFLTWIVVYYILTLIGSIPQSGFSDAYGRKKHLLISSICILLSAVYLSIMYILTRNIIDLSSFSLSILTTLPVCILLGALGNAIPIARAGIADLKIHDFRTAMGWSTTFIGFGWITAILLGFILPPLGTLISAMIIQLLVILITWFFFENRENLNISPHCSPKNIIIESYRWCISMFLVAGGTAAICAYLFTESSFYLIYSLKEEGVVDIGIKTTGIVMAFGYAFGVIMQWIVSCSNRVGIKFGIVFSTISLLLLVVIQYFLPNSVEIFGKDNFFLMEGILNFLFSFGYGFFVPSLFSLMATHITSHHFGKLFGAIDTTDTVALVISSGILYLYGKFKFNDLLIGFLLLSFFLVSFIFFRIFLNKFLTYEKSSEKRNINFEKK